MDHLYTKTAILRKPEFIGADCEAIGTWYRVLAYCAEQENGGVIVGAAEWQDRAWIHSCNCTADEVRQAHPLLRIEKNDVIVMDYPAEKQKSLQAMREGGGRGNKGVGSHPSTHPKTKPSLTDPSIEGGMQGDIQGGRQGGVNGGRQGGTDRLIDREREGRKEGSLTFLAEVFSGSHPACQGLDQIHVINLMRGHSQDEIKEAIDAFAKQWAGAEFPASSPPLKEFSKYLRRAESVLRKNKAQEPVTAESRQVYGGAM